MLKKTRATSKWHGRGPWNGQTVPKLWLYNMRKTVVGHGWHNHAIRHRQTVPNLGTTARGVDGKIGTS